MFYTDQGSAAWFPWLGGQLCSLNLMTWLCVCACECVCVCVCVCACVCAWASQNALACWWFKNNQAERAHYSLLFQFYVRELHVNSVCVDVCLLTLLCRMTTQMDAVSVGRRPLSSPPRTRPLFSGRKPISHLAETEVHQRVFLILTLSVFLCTFPFHLQLNARIIPHLCQLPAVPTVRPATPWGTLHSLSYTSLKTPHCGDKVQKKTLECVCVIQLPS